MKNFQVLVADAGNLFFSKDVISEGVTLDIAKGKAAIIRDCFNEIGCSAFSPGSQDFAGGLDFLRDLQNGARFDFISANIYNSKTNDLLFKPYKIENVNGTKVGFIGLTSQFSSPGITVTEPMSALKDVYSEIRRKTDVIVLLFHSSEKDIRKFNSLALDIDLVLRSDSKVRSKDGGTKPVPVYSLGDRGKYLYQFDFMNNEPGQPFIDKIAFTNLIKNSEKKLDRISAGNLNANLRDIYKNDPQTLSKINQAYSNIDNSKIVLENIINEIVMTKHELGKDVDSKTDILQIIDVGKAKLEGLYGPIEPVYYPHGHPLHTH